MSILKIIGGGLVVVGVITIADTVFGIEFTAPNIMVLMYKATLLFLGGAIFYMMERE